MNYIPLYLRVNGIIFERVRVRKIGSQKVYKFELLISDRLFGEFPLTDTMNLEIKEDGRWKRIKLTPLVLQVV